MSVSELKSHLHQSIDLIEDEQFLKDLSKLIETRSQVDFWDELSDETKASIERGMADAQAGRVQDAWEVLAKLKSRKHKS